jgi:alpha-amylase/alpha-mannosidase (GH57 family)
MNRYICIHGHFYQPPRENAWLEEIEVQDSAYPFHDWNQRISRECYAPNTAARILDGEHRIVDIISNYSRISFNFGPTLLSWMEKSDTETYQAILKADQQSRDRFSGHGSAIAQVYNHMIMPLANERDRRTQILWGIKDFKHRFQREPEGMWLPETAVDLLTLEILAEAGVAFTILSPYQAGKIRKTGEKEWSDISGGKINPRQPYQCHLPSGNAIALFFYDGPISQQLGFGDLLQSGEKLANHLLGAFLKEEDKPQLVHVATDGETYGHHRRHGDMALAYSLQHIEENKLAQLTNYGEYLEKYPPTHEVEIIENTSWSCMHGIERWRSDCGCNTGMHGNWHQKWREPLRNAMDHLRDSLTGIYEKVLSPFCDKPWNARDEYIDVILDRDKENVNRFLQENFREALTDDEKIFVLKALELERHAMLMYTSCGWFFDEISGIETTQVIQYAARAIQLAREIAQIDLEPDYIADLSKAPSNLPEFGTGGEVYKRLIQPAEIDLLRVAAHYAISSAFQDYPEAIHIFCFDFRNRDYDKIITGNIQEIVGRATVSSRITREQMEFSFAVLSLGGHMLNGAVREFSKMQAYDKMHREITDAFRQSDIPEVIRLMDYHFKTHNYNLWHLFRDEQRRVFNHILEKTLQEIEFHYRNIFNSVFVLVQAMKNLHVPLPDAIKTPVQFILNRDLKQALGEENGDPAAIDTLVKEYQQLNIEPEKLSLNLEVTRKINTLLKNFRENPQDVESLSRITELVNKLGQLNLDCDCWEAQNIFFKILRQTYPSMNEKQAAGNEKAGQWLEDFQRLGNILKVKVPG